MEANRLAEFRVRRRESDMIRFLPRPVRGRKHFARSERRIVRFQRTTEAQSAAKLSQKSGFATFSTVSHFAFLLTPKHADLILPVKRFLSCLLFFHLAKEQQNSCCKRHSPIAHDPPNMWKDSGKIPGQHSFFQSNGMNIGQDIS